MLKIFNSRTQTKQFACPTHFVSRAGIEYYIFSTVFASRRLDMLKLFNSRTQAKQFACSHKITCVEGGN